jgi:tetratricopeptide (TPR) repeat protein
VVNARISAMPEDPKHAAEDHYYRALDLFSDNQQELAVEEYKKAIELDPTFTDAMHGLTRAYQDLGRLDEAITVAQMITAHDPEDILGHTSLSILFQKKGMIPEAEAEANQARILGWKQQLKAKK